MSVNKAFLQIEQSGEVLPTASSSNHESDSSVVAEMRSNLSITYRTIESLTPYQGNPRTHSKQQIHKLKESIRAFGFVNPVLITKDGGIIAGHGRVYAARQLKFTKVPTVCLEDLTPDQVRAYALADNRLALDAGWDEDLLRIEMVHLESLLDFEVSLTGFEIPD